MIRRFLFAAIAFAASLTAAVAEERVERFVSDVEVQRNGDLIVTETIQVWAEGNKIVRGILRDFPTVYHRADGSRVEVGFDVQYVMRDHLYENFTTERMANGVRVRIGNASRTLNTGSHIYEIKYRTTRQIGFFKSYDELYWNATGTGWTFPIEVAEARIKLPAGQGMFPAFWMLPATYNWDYNDDQGELDIMEMIGKAPTRAEGHSHRFGKVWGGVFDNGTDLTKDFHTYGLDWEPDRLTWYVDGKA